MIIQHLDHLVLTVRDIEITCDFYHRLLGMDIVEFGSGRRALVFGHQKINLHPRGGEFAPHAVHPTPGSADLCFLLSVPLEHFMHRCRDHGVNILAGPVRREGAAGPILSVYLRDPDGNLLEIAQPFSAAAGSEEGDGGQAPDDSSP